MGEFELIWKKSCELLAVKVLKRLGSVSPASLSHALRCSVALRHLRQLRHLRRWRRCAALQRIFALPQDFTFSVIFYSIFILCAYNPQKCLACCCIQKQRIYPAFFSCNRSRGKRPLPGPEDILLIYIVTNQTSLWFCCSVVVWKSALFTIFKNS